MSHSTSPQLSIAIPAHNEERFIGRCIETVFHSAQRGGTSVEVVVALNRCTDGTQRLAESLGARCVVEDSKCIAAVRNAAVRGTRSNAVVTIDADSWMQPHTVQAVMGKINDPRFVGGGSAMWPERWSLGIFVTGLMVAKRIAGKGISGGMFWFQREHFEAVNGFDESLVSVEDLDFALRLKAWGAARGQHFGTVYRGGIITSCRKFDTFGDWYLVRNPQLVDRIFQGKDRAAADHYYYDVKR